MSGSDHMMRAAHTITGGALGLVALIFAGAVALFVWTRYRR